MLLGLQLGEHSILEPLHKTHNINPLSITTFFHSSSSYLPSFSLIFAFSLCDAPFPRGPLTTRQPTEYSWMSGNRTPLMKIGQSLLCTGSSTQGTTCHNHMATCPNILQRPNRVHIWIKMSKMATWAHALILTKLHQLFTNISRVITILLTKNISKFKVLIHVLQNEYQKHQSHNPAFF